MTIRFILCSKNTPGKELKPVYLENIKKDIPKLDADFKKRQKNIENILNAVNNNPKEVFNEKNFKAINSGVFKTTLKNNKIAVTVGETKFSVLPEEGAVITQWLINNKNQVNGKICLNRFYLPKRKNYNITGTFQLKSQKVKNKRLNMVFENSFENINIRKTFSFSPDGKSFKVNCQIKNNSRDFQTIGFWYWNTFTAGMWENNPQLQASAKSFKINSTVFYKSGKAPMVKNILGSVEYKDSKGLKNIALESSNGIISLSTESPDVAGFLSWAVRKQKFSTLELLFKAKVLKPGQNISYPLNYKYIQN